jgi:hypothetical protein
MYRSGENGTDQRPRIIPVPSVGSSAGCSMSLPANSTDSALRTLSHSHPFRNDRNCGRARAARALPLLLGLLSILVLSSAANALVTPSVLPTAGAVPSTLAPSTTTANSQIQAAASSLEQGAGPAHGSPARCSGTTGSGASLSCSFGAEPRQHAASPQIGAPPPSWQLIGGPAGTYGGTMVWDGADQYVLMFGTGNDENATSQTWEYKAGVWTDLSPAVSPPARVSPFMAYDPIDGYVVMFGGWGGVNGGASEFGDTWTYVAGVWTELRSLYSPSARDSGAMTWDGADGYLVMYGDYAGTNDTWSFVNGGWTEQIASAACTGPGGPTPCPPAVEDEGLAYDPTDGYVVLFGGSTYTGSTNYMQQTWTYSAGHWANVTANPCTATNCPSAREDVSMTWDAADGYILLFGGYNGHDQGDTWKFLGGTWTELRSSASCTGGLCPSSRDGAMIAFDYNDNYVVLFGGYSNLEDTWQYIAEAWHLVTQNTTPVSRGEASIAYDAADGYVVLFGGTNSGALGDTWKFAVGQWTEAVPAGGCTASTCPSARSGTNLTYDAADGYVVLFGGENAGTFLRDTWRFSAGAWTNFGLACTGGTCPSARQGFAMDYDPVLSEVVLFGGQSSGGLQQDTWTFAAGAWTNLGIACSPTTCPSARTGASIAYDAADGYLMLFGGQTGASTYVNDTWKFTGAWSEISSGACTYAAPCPSGRAGASMDYDPVLGQVVLFGGQGSKLDSDTWTYSAGLWTKQYFYTYPPARQLGGMVWDGSLQGLILFGGWDLGPLGDTWTFVAPLFAETPYVSPSNPSDIGESVILTATAVGGGLGSSYTYLWQGLPPGCAATAPTSTVACTVTTNGTFYVSTIVLDSTGVPAQSSYQAAVVVNPDPLVSVSTTNSTVDLGQYVNFTAFMIYGTGLPSFYWKGLPPSCVSAMTTPTLACQPLSASDIGAWDVTVVAVDADGFSSPAATVAIHILADPKVSTISMSRSSLDLGQSTVLSASAVDGSGGYTYVWSGLPAGCGGSAATITCAPIAIGSGSFTPMVQVYDASGAWSASASAAGPLSVYADPTVSGLTITGPSGATDEITLGDSVSFSATTTPGAAPDATAWFGLPAGCSAAPAATTVSCTPTATGAYLPVLAETDANGMAATSLATVFTVEPVATPPPPEAMSLELTAAPATIDAGQMTTLTGSISGGNGPFSYTWSGLPNSCPASATPQVSCTPTTAGTFTVSLQVTDADQVMASAAVSLQVGAPLVASSLTVSSTSVNVGSPLTISVAAAGGSGTYHYAWSGLPTGCLASNTAVISCEPTATGSFAVAATVTDSSGATGSSPATTVVISAAPAPASGFGAGASDLDWTILALVVVAIVIGLLSLVMSARRPKQPASRAPAQLNDWSEENGAKAPSAARPRDSAPPTPSSSGQAPASGNGSGSTSAPVSMTMAAARLSWTEGRASSGSPIAAQGRTRQPPAV